MSRQEEWTEKARRRPWIAFAPRRELPTNAGVPSDQMHAALRDRHRAGSHSGKPRNLAETATKRLAEQLERARRLHEFGEYDRDTFSARRDDIQEQQRQLAEAGQSESIDVEWFEAQLLDLVATWEAADPGQRSRLWSRYVDHQFGLSH